MSNVEYRCPHTDSEGNRDCGMRHFGLPGGTRHKCRKHDIEYVQTEATTAPDFLFIDEEGKTKSQDALVGEEKLRASSGQTKGEVTEVAPTMEIAIWRENYRTIVGEEPDKRWGAARLKDEINDWKESLSAGEGNEQENGEEEVETPETEDENNDQLV